MRVFTWIVRSMTVGAVLICIVMIGLAPQTVVTHFNTAGIGDMLGSRGWLVLLPAFLIVLAEIVLRVARQKRRRLGLLHSTQLTGFEGECLAVMVSVSVLLWVMMQSEIQNRLLGS